MRAKEVREAIKAGRVTFAEPRPEEELGVPEFDEAFKAARSYPGMGSLMLRFDPYHCQWIAEISYSDGTKYAARHADAREALKRATAMHRESPPMLGTFSKLL